MHFKIRATPLDLSEYGEAFPPKGRSRRRRCHALGVFQRPSGGRRYHLFAPDCNAIAHTVAQWSLLPTELTLVAAARAVDVGGLGENRAIPTERFVLQGRPRCCESGLRRSARDREGGRGARKLRKEEEKQAYEAKIAERRKATKGDA